MKNLNHPKLKVLGQCTILLTVTEISIYSLTMALTTPLSVADKFLSFLFVVMGTERDLLSIPLSVQMCLPKLLRLSTGKKNKDQLRKKKLMRKGKQRNNNI